MYAPAAPDGQPDYPILDEDGVLRYVAGTAVLARRLGGSPADWTAREIGDGNVNLVFSVTGPLGAVCVKQALPYVRAAGPDWPLHPGRNGFEFKALTEHRKSAERYLPEPLHHEPALHLMAVEYLTEHTVLRDGLIQGICYPNFAKHIAEYLARSLFFTSDLALSAERKRLLVSEFETNTEMCGVMEDMVFTDIYVHHPRNRWTSPALDTEAERLRCDTALKLAVSRLKGRYLTSKEALIHGDLHTGSIMVTAQSTRVIDQEFACFGPMGFDLGNVLAHLFISYFAQDGLSLASEPGVDRHEWLLDTIETLWDNFHAHFLRLWQSTGSGSSYPPALFSDPEGSAALDRERRSCLDLLLADALGFCAAEILRRLFGFARPADLTSITDPVRRSACERPALHLARSLLSRPTAYPRIHDVTATARTLRKATSEA
ncbi:S-methyl-5-thioribose kinase [Streptomyces sp. NPDC057424]|uniref:S-methyl-5-thioribose kinase n=1 Tax=Streptomyces sp. NPDC057424 TaxID=3346127 RepID=UPI0036B50C9F